MLGVTHSTFGVACALGGLILTKQADPLIAGIAIASASVGALSPDLDHPQATLSRKNVVFGAISQIMSHLSSHRRFWHTIPACMIFSAAYFGILYLFGSLIGTGMSGVTKVPDLMPYYIVATIYFFVGAISHLIADAMNPQGSPLLFPIQMDLNKKVHIPIICVETGSPGELIYRTVFAILVAILGYIYLVSLLHIDVMKLILF